MIEDVGHAAHLDWRQPRPVNCPHFEMGLNAAYHCYDWMLDLGELRGLRRRAGDIAEVASGRPANARSVDNSSGEVNLTSLG